MSSKSFVKILRKIIREEVTAAVKEILTEQKPHFNKVINHGMNLNEMASNPTKRKKKRFTKNNMLNDILNETSGVPSNGPSVMQEEYPTMNSFKSDMAESYGMNRQPQSLATTGINGEPINMQNAAVAKTVDMMTKDYSGLMKAIDKKKNR